MEIPESIGLLWQREKEGGPPVYRGTCFALFDATFFLTAAHCLEGSEENQLLVEVPSAGQFTVVERAIHPSADLAVLKLLPDAPIQPLFPLSGFAWRADVGQDFIAFGFPEDVFGEVPQLGKRSELRPTARLFKGHFQRFFHYRRSFGVPYEYHAGEMSISTPKGLSGGPVFQWVGSMSSVIGIVTDNLKSYANLSAVEETSEENRVEKNLFYEVINYGICLMIGEVMDWIGPLIPPREAKPKGSEDGSASPDGTAGS